MKLMIDLIWVFKIYKLILDSEVYHSTGRITKTKIRHSARARPVVEYSSVSF